MSSPLDGRIRKLAREEAATLMGDNPAPAAAADDDRVVALEKEVADLRRRLVAVEALASRTQAADDAAAPTKTSTRRTRSTSE